MTAPPPRPRALRSGWTMWLAVWLATVVASGLAVLGSWQLTSETFEARLEESLATQVGAQAAMAAASLQPTPVESVVAVGGERSLGRLSEELRRMRDVGGLHDLALLGPEGVTLAATGSQWLAADADAVLIADARDGRARVGPLYGGIDGEAYLAAYAPLAGHPGWVVAVEGSGAPLEAADRMETELAWVSALVMLMAALAGGVLATTALGPLRRLARDLGRVRPGDEPGLVREGGPAEVRLVAEAARELLAAVRLRDEELRSTHDRELRQVSALAAAVAHEVRNPLNAIGLAMRRLERVDPGERARLREQLHDLLGEIEVIVERFMDLSRPPEPVVVAVQLEQLWAELAVEAEAVGIGLTLPEGGGPIRTDPSLVRQALRNLLRNAAEAGAGHASIRVVRRGPTVLELSDDGPGIPADQVDRLFDWFHTTRAQGGGLGLPSARRALRALGGELELVDGERAVFHVTIEGGLP